MTDADKTNILIKEGEGLTVEFKEHFTPRIDEDIVAFANTKGGGSKEKKLGEKLGENQNRILENITKNKFVTIPELLRMLGISTTAVENNLAKLKKILKRIGPDKGGHWEIVDISRQTD